jgi:hypothetical protein
MKKTLLFVLVLTFGISLMGISVAIAGGYSCCPKGPGTGTPGYWKNHPDAWPVDEICLDGTCFTKEEAIEILDGPVAGDKWITQFKAYVAAYLNVEIGNCRPYCDSGWGVLDLDDGYTWLVNNLGDRPVKARSDEWQYSHGEAIYWCLDDYNNGYLPMAISRDELE